jgi:selT/selW/selH-like putative selenoprotein
VKKTRGIESELVKGSGGQFEVSLDGRLIFSKKKEGRFPLTNEILDQIPEASAR